MYVLKKQLLFKKISNIQLCNRREGGIMALIYVLYNEFVNN